MSEPSSSERVESTGTWLSLPVRAHLRTAVGEAASRRIWGGIEARLREDRPRPASRRVGVLVLSTLLLLSGVLVWVTSSRLVLWERIVGPRELVLADGRAFEGIDGGVARFADGSRIEAEPGANVEALASTASELSLVVRRGRARFLVTPGGARRWLIEARGVRVEVVGTVLSVEADEQAVRVEVEVGSVVVRSPMIADGVRRLGAGEALELRVLATIAAASSSAPEPAASSIATPAPAHGPSPRRSRAASDAPAPASRTDLTRELWSRADAARASGDAAQAIALLERLLSEHPEDPEAPLGAFTLGTVLVEQGRAEQAASAFRRALELGLPPVLRDLCQRRLEELESKPASGAAPTRTPP